MEFLELILSPKGQTAKRKLNGKKAFLQYIARDSVHKYDKNLKIGKGKVKDMLEEQGFYDEYQRLGKNLSLHGKGYALVAYLVDGKPYASSAQVASFKSVLGVLQEVQLVTENYTQVGEEKAPHYISFKREGGKIVKSEKFTVNGEIKIVADSVVEYPGAKIPVQLMYNNSLREADIPEYLRPMVEEYGEYLDKLREEVEKSKAIFLNNNIFNSKQTAEVMEKKIVGEGKSFVDVNDEDGKLANAMAPMVVGNSGISNIEMVMGFLESRIKLFSHQFRDHQTGAAAPTETQIAMYNQQAFEYMMNKLEFRQRQLQGFINIFAELAGTTAPTVKLQVTELEQAKIDSLEASRQLQVAQAKQAKGIAEKNIAESETLRAGIGKTELEQQQPAIQAKAALPAEAEQEETKEEE